MRATPSFSANLTERISTTAVTSSSPSTTPQLSALPSVPHVVPDPAVDYTPTRKIFTEADIANWIDSEAYYCIELIIARLSVAVDGKKIEDTCHESEVRLKAKALQLEGQLGAPLTSPCRVGSGRQSVCAVPRGPDGQGRRCYA